MPMLKKKRGPWKGDSVGQGFPLMSGSTGEQDED